MQWLAISRHWSAFAPAILERWPEAEETDLLALDGTQTTLALYLADRTGREVTEVNDEIEDWRAGATPADLRMDEREDMRNISDSERWIPEGEDVYDNDAAFGDDDQAERPLGRTG